MDEQISKIISYIKATESPLSADIGIIRGKERIWLYDVGNGQQAYDEMLQVVKDKKIGVVISHFHPDHMGNMNHILTDTLYLGENTKKYLPRGTVVNQDLFLEDGCKLHLFPLPSSHAKGSLGLEVNEQYAFLGDGTYATTKGGVTGYNAQILWEEIKVLKSLKAHYFLLSHQEEFVQEKEQVISSLEEIYGRRDKNTSFISVDKRE